MHGLVALLLLPVSASSYGGRHTPLIQATVLLGTETCVRVVDFYLFPFQVDCEDCQDLSPLLLACRHGHDSCVSLLLSHGAKINAQTAEAK